MSILILGLVLFLGVHSLSLLAPNWRARTLNQLGEAPWQGLTGLIALIGFVLICWGYAEARVHPIALYASPVWTRHLSLLIMLPVFPLLFATYLPGRIQTLVVHPTLTAVILWSICHLLSNGNLADLVLFGAFLLWSLADRLSLLLTDRIATPIQGAPPHRANDLIAIGAGLVLYCVFLFWAHAWLFGVSPLGVAY